jgi:hypothetical protein
LAFRSLAKESPMNKCVVGLTALAWALVAPQARAEFITFDGLPYGTYFYNTTGRVNGFNVSGVGIVDWRGGGYAGFDRPYNGTDYARFYGSPGLSLTHPWGTPFALHSFDATEGDSFAPGRQSILVMGWRPDGKIVSAIFWTNPREKGETPFFQRFTLGSGWDKLLSVRFANPTDQSWIAIDNINVTPPASAPEPGCLALLASGALAALGFARRRFLRWRCSNRSDPLS